MADVQAAKLIIDVVSDANKTTKDLDKLDKKIKDTGDTTKKFSDENKALSNSLLSLKNIVLATATVAFYKYVRFCGEAIKAASDLEEQTSKFNTVFGSLAKSMGKDVNDLVVSYAMSTREARQYLGAMQDLLVPMGLNADLASKMSGEIVRLSADLGSFNNMATPDVMMALQSAMVGNYETMKKFGVVLNEELVQMEALRMGLVNTKGQLDTVAKAQAAYSLILKGTTAAHGDMIRTGESYANTVKKMKAAQEDFNARFGKEMMKGASDFANALGSVMEKGTPLSDLFLDLARIGTGALQEIAKAILDLNIKVGQMRLGWTMLKNDVYDLASAQKELAELNKSGMGDSARARQLKQVLDAQTAVEGAIVTAIRQSGEYSEVVETLGNNMRRITLESSEYGRVVIEVTEKEYQAYTNAAKGAAKYGDALKNLQKGKILGGAKGGKSELDELLKMFAKFGEVGASFTLLAKEREKASRLVQKYGIDDIQMEKYFSDQRLKVIRDFVNNASSDETKSFDERRANLEAQYAKLLETENLSNEERLAAKKAYIEASNALNMQEMEAATAVTNFMANSISQISELYSMSLQNRLTELDNAHNDELSMLADQLKKGTISKEEYEAKKYEIDQQYEDKKRQMQKEGFEVSKGLQIAETLMQIPGAAFAAYKAMVGIPVVGPTLAAMAAIAATAFGFAKVAMISAQEFPAAAMGGSFMVPPGNEADSGLLRVSQGEQVDVTPVRETTSGPQRMVVSIGGRDFEAFLVDELNRTLNSGKVQIRRRGAVKVA